MRTQLKTISVTSLQTMLKLTQSQVLCLIATILRGIQKISLTLGSTISQQAFSIWTIDNKLLFYYMIRSESSNLDINENTDADLKYLAFSSILLLSLLLHILSNMYMNVHIKQLENGKSKNAVFIIIICFVCNANPR